MRPRSSIQRSLQAETKEAKANKRQCLMSGAMAPRFQGQTILEQVAISAPVALDFANRVAKFFGTLPDQGHPTRIRHEVRRVLEHLSQQHVRGRGRRFGRKQNLCRGVSKARLFFDGALPRSRRCLKGWSNMDPGMTRPPLPYPLIALIASQLLDQDLGEACLVVLLMFSAYLRPSKALGLHANDIVRPSRAVKHVAINLHPADRYESSKTLRRDGHLRLAHSALPGSVAIETASQHQTLDGSQAMGERLQCPPMRGPKQALFGVLEASGPHPAGRSARRKVSWPKDGKVGFTK